MDIIEMFPGRYIKAETLNGKARTYHVAAVERIKLSDGSLNPVITFEDEDMSSSSTGLTPTRSSRFTAGTPTTGSAS